MGIANDEQFTGIDFVHRQEILDGFAEGAKRLIVIEVADMLADESLAINDEGDGIFQVRAYSQDRTSGGKFGRGAWCVAACTAENGRAENAGADDRIVDTASYGALAD